MHDQSNWTLTRKLYYSVKLHNAKKTYNKLSSIPNDSKEHQAKLLKLSKKIIKYNNKLKDINDYQASHVKEKIIRNHERIQKEKYGEEDIIDKFKKYNNYTNLDKYEDESDDRGKEKKEFETRRDSHIYRLTN